MVAKAAGGGEVRLRGLEKRFGDTVALHPLDLVIEDGEFVVLVGPSGCGKTTVLRLIAGLDEPTTGEILIGQRDVTHVEPADRDIAMVFQNYALYPHKTVRENLAFGLRMRKRPAGEIDRAVARAADVLGLQSLLDRRPAQLSGGQKQRVAVGRAMVREPSVFLFDEPLSNLDAQLRAELRRELADLHARLATTMIYVTHDQVEAMTLGARIAVLDDGRLQQYSAALDIYERPANLFVARFVGTPAINTVPGEVAIADGRASFTCSGLGLEGEAAPSASYRGACTLALRPEGLQLAAPPRSHPADAGSDAVVVASRVGRPAFVTRVQRLEPLGNEILVHVDGPASTTWVARVPPDQRLSTDDVVSVSLDTSRAHLFGADGARLPALPR